MSDFVPAVSAPAHVNGTPAHWFVVRTGEVLMIGDEGVVPYGERPDVGSEGEPIYLGTLDGEPCWAVGAEAQAPPGAGLRWEHLQPMGLRLPETLWALSGRAVQLVEWARTHRYCGRCGTATVAADGERAMRCPACGLVAFPRLAPAIIVLVRRGDQALLAQGRNFPAGLYSTLAGFVEPGETLEQAVRREVQEEVGVQVGSVRYFGSQPWPFPHSLMVGFNADWETGDISIDPVEIADAKWFARRDLPAIPPSMSIARRLINAWLEEPAGG